MFLSDEHGDYNVTRDIHMVLVVFLMITGLFLFVDGWLMFDGLLYICFFDVTSNAWKLLEVEVQDDDGDYSDIRESRVRPVTRCPMQHMISSLA